MGQLAPRNNWLVQSNHPLRETIIAATGSTATARDRFYRRAYEAVNAVAKGPCEAPPVHPFPFEEHLGGG
jgi:hypothetical protein